MLDVYLFREDRVLPYRHMFYQYGDIQLATAQDVLADSKGVVCQWYGGQNEGGGHTASTGSWPLVM